MTSIFNPKLVCLFFLCFKSITFIVSCNSDSSQITLKEWLNDEAVYKELLVEVNADNCDKIKQLYDKLTLIEFKSRVYGYLTPCSKDNKKLLKKYILQNVAAGLHPTRIDSIEYTSVYNDIKDDIYKLHHKFWKNKDTSHFIEMEKRVLKEQTLRIQARTTPSDKIYEEMRKVDSSNIEYLKYMCANKGFPIPIEPSKSQSFRAVSASIIAVHAPDKNKIEFINCAVKNAKTGDISWDIPIHINSGLFISGISQKDVYPLWLIYFYKKDNLLNLKKSYLQLYTIKRLYNKDMIRNIKIQPSKYNNSDKELINSQLEEIKHVLIDEFLFDPDYLTISEIPDTRELDYRETAPYSFTLSVLD